MIRTIGSPPTLTKTHTHTIRHSQPPGAFHPTTPSAIGRATGKPARTARGCRTRRDPTPPALGGKPPAALGGHPVDPLGGHRGGNADLVGVVDGGGDGGRVEVEEILDMVSDLASSSAQSL